MLDIFKALSEENRFRIVMLLSQREMCVCEIFSILDISNSTLSSHLKILKQANIIKQKKNGRWINYSLINNATITMLLDFIKKNMNDNTLILEDKLKSKEISQEKCSMSYKETSNLKKT